MKSVALRGRSIGSRLANRFPSKQIVSLGWPASIDSYDRLEGSLWLDGVCLVVLFRWLICWPIELRAIHEAAQRLPRDIPGKGRDMKTTRAKNVVNLCVRENTHTLRNTRLRTMQLSSLSEGLAGQCARFIFMFFVSMPPLVLAFWDPVTKRSTRLGCCSLPTFRDTPFKNLFHISAPHLPSPPLRNRSSNRMPSTSFASRSLSATSNLGSTVAVST